MSLLYAILLFLFAYGIGRTAWAALNRHGSLDDTVGEAAGHVMSIGLGAAVIGTFTMPLAAAGLGRLPCSILVLAVIAFALYGLVVLWRTRHELRRVLWEDLNTADRAGLCFVAASGLMTLFLAWRPTITVDDWMYHLTVPRQWLITGGIPDMPHEVHAHFNLLTESWTLWGLVLAPDDYLLTKLTQVVASVCVALLCGLTVRRLFDSTAGWIAGACWTLMLVTLEHAASNYIDVGHAFLLLSGVLVTAHAMPRQTGRFQAMAFTGGLLLGCAAASKASGLMTGAIMGGLLTLRALKPRESVPVLQRLSFLVQYGMAILLIMTPWWVKNTLHTGNPLYPFALGIFGAHPEDLATAMDFHAYYMNYKIPLGSIEEIKGLLDFLYLFSTNIWLLDYNRVAAAFLLLSPLYIHLAFGSPSGRSRLSFNTPRGLLFLAGLIMLPPVVMNPARRFALGMIALQVILIAGMLASLLARRGPSLRRATFAACLLLWVAMMVRAPQFGLPSFPYRKPLEQRLWLTQSEMHAHYYSELFPMYENIGMIEDTVGEDGLLMLTENREISALFNIPLLQNPHLLSVPIYMVFAVQEKKTAEELARYVEDHGVTHLLTLPDPFESRHPRGGIMRENDELRRWRREHLREIARFGDKGVLWEWRGQ